MQLSADAFIRRFLLHRLPKGLHRIRHFGILANGAKTLDAVRSLTSPTPTTTTLPPTPGSAPTAAPPCGSFSTSDARASPPKNAPFSTPCSANAGLQHHSRRHDRTDIPAAQTVGVPPLCVLMTADCRPQPSRTPCQGDRTHPAGPFVTGRTSRPDVGQHASSRVRKQHLLHTFCMSTPGRRGLRPNPLSDGAPAVTNQNLARTLRSLTTVQARWYHVAYDE